MPPSGGCFLYSVLELHPFELFAEGAAEDQEEDHIGHRVAYGVGDGGRKGGQVELPAEALAVPEHGPDVHYKRICHAGERTVNGQRDPAF